MTKTGWWWCGAADPEAGRCCGVRWRRGVRCCIRRPRREPSRVDAVVLVINVRQWSSNRRMRWRSSRSPRCTTPSIRAHRASGIRWWSMSTPRCWRSRSAGPVRSRGRRARFRGNVPPTGVDASRTVIRHEEGGGRGDRGTDPDHSVRLTAGAPPSGPELSLSRVRRPGRQAHHLHHWARAARRSSQSRAALPAASPRGARRGLSGRRGPDGTLQFRRPTAARSLRCRPPLQAPEILSRSSGHVTRPRAFASARARPTRTGSESAWTLGWAIDVLHPLAGPRRS